MEYRTIPVEELPTTPDRPCDRRAIGESAGLEKLAVNRYEAAPGEQLPLAYHYHDDQEELFYVLSGSLAVETPDGEFEVGPDEVFVAYPGSPHRAYNPADADRSVRVLALGAPSVDDVHPHEP